MQWYPGVPGLAEGGLSQLPNLKTLVVVSKTYSELRSLDMDSLHLRCALDATAMEISTLKEWFQFRRAFDVTLSRMKHMLDQSKETRGLGKHAEISVMKLYNC